FTMLSGGPQGGIFRSDDNGATWRKLHGNGLPEGSVGRVGVAAATHGRVYAIIQSRGGDVWRSDDGGATWKVMPHDPYVGARPFYFSHLFVDPANRDRVISVGLILSMSTDGARKFHVIAKNGGWDYHDIWWSKDGRRIAIASDEGVLFSRDGGERAWQPYDLPFAQPYHIGFNHGVPSYAICIGLQDDSSWCGPSNPANGIGTINRSWYQTVYSGDGMWSVFDPKDPSLVWSTSTNSDTGEVFLTSLRTSQQFEVSPDAEINGERAADSLKYRFNWDTPIAFASDGSALVGGNVVFKSSDRGQTWSVISPDLTRNERSKQGAPGGAISVDESGAEIYNTILDIEPARDAVGQIWVSSDDGLVHLTRDDGASWQNVTPAGLPEGRIDTVEPGHGSPGTAYIALQRHMSGDDRPYVYLTDDFGAHWSSIASNLPRNLFVRSIREDPTSRNLLYVGTQRGIFISFDRGRSWQPFRLNMPATAIYDLQIQPEMNDLVVASHGRGVWILDDLSPVQQLEKARGTQVTLFPIQAAYRMSQNPPVHTFTDPALPDNEFIGESRPYGALIDYYLAKAAKSVEIDVVDAQGRAVRRLRGKSIPKTEGIDRTSWDLLEDGPVKWNGTYALNRGPDEGPEAVPGSYTVRLIVDGVTQEQPLVVTADPRDTSGPQQAVARRQFLETLMSELSGVDTMLNAIDDRLKVAGEPERSALLALRERLTYDPQNVEDLRGPAQLRERILDLLSRVGAQSFQGPNAPEAAEAANVQTAYQAVESAFKQL
ncbi:MAG: hypothetical protein ABI278_07825, partial [Candidatus Aquilonibacter sp.]